MWILSPLGCDGQKGVLPRHLLGDHQTAAETAVGLPKYSSHGGSRAIEEMEDFVYKEE
jgi:hypothetical protein